MEVLALAGRVVLSLVVVLVLLWLAARGLRKGQRRSQHGIEVDVLARQPLAQRSSVAVVQVGERALVLGVTEHRVELLTEQPLADLLKLGPVADPVEALIDGAHHGESPVVAPQPPTRTAARTANRQQPQGGLAGSALSPATWAKAVDAVREMTVRR